MAKRRYDSLRSGYSLAEKQKIINDYREATGVEEIDMRAVALWAQVNGRMPPPKQVDPVKLFAHELSEAAREEYYTDPQGREARKKHCYVVVEPNGQRRWQWVDIEDAKREPMHKSLHARRDQSLGDVKQTDIDRRSWDDNNKHGGFIEMSFNFDEDLAEAQMPTEYPEGPETDEPRGETPPSEAR